jgi:hypothetical protein
MNFPSSEIFEESRQVWGAELQPAGCPVCRQTFLVEAARLGQPCPNCARGKLESQPARLRPEEPELLLPFARQPADLRAALENFIKPIWLRPDDLNAEALLKRLTPVFTPMWLVDSDVAGEWRAEVGFDYQVKSSQDSYAGGGWQTREVVETRIRWEPRLGQIQRRYNNVAVAALSDQKRLAQLVGQYPLPKARAYAAGALKGAALRVPDLPPESAWPFAQSQLEQLAAQDCAAAAGGQHTRSVNLNVNYDSLHWTQLLLPLYVTFYTADDGQPQPIYVNGQTGQIGGRRLASQRKGWMYAGLVGAVAAAALVFGLIVSAIGALFPPALIVGGLIVIAAFAIGVGALAPALWPWQWNRGQAEARVTTTDRHR